MLSKQKSNLQDFNAFAFEVNKNKKTRRSLQTDPAYHQLIPLNQDLLIFKASLKRSGELTLGIIPTGETKSGASKFKIFLGVQRIGTMYQITPNLFSTMLSYEFGGQTKEFTDPKLATDWLVNRYFDWVDGDIKIEAVKFGYEIRHDRIYIGFVNYSELYGEWVATSYPDRFSIFTITEHHEEFSDAVQFIINEYLYRNSDLEPRELTII